MKVTVIGAGNMGSAFVKQLHAAGHAIQVTARSADKASALAAQYSGVKAVSAREAGNADALILATHYADAVSALQAIPHLDGKIVIDITNPLTADYMGLTVGHSTSAAEEIAHALPQVRVVKAFNTLFAQVISEGADFGQGQTAPAFIASDDAEAKTAVTILAQSLGFATVDAGPLKNARYLEPVAGLNIYFGYGAGLGTGIAPTWLHKQ